MKTIKDVLEKWPDGWPEPMYNFCFTHGKDLQYGDDVSCFDFAYEDGSIDESDEKRDYSGLIMSDTAWSLCCTREQYEQARREKMKEQEWTHGLPLGGMYCQVNDNNEWVNCYLIGRDDAGAFVYRVDGEYAAKSDEKCFRPIKPEREKLIDEFKCDTYLYAINTSDEISMRQSTGEHLAGLVIGYLFDKGWRPSS